MAVIRKVLGAVDKAQAGELVRLTVRKGTMDQVFSQSAQAAQVAIIRAQVELAAEVQMQFMEFWGKIRAANPGLAAFPNAQVDTETLEVFAMVDEGSVVNLVPEPAAPQPGEAAPVDFLLGSSAFPAMIETAGDPVQLGAVVAAAHVRSGLSVEAWNALADAERDALLLAEVQLMRYPPEEQKSAEPIDEPQSDAPLPGADAPAA